MLNSFLCHAQHAHTLNQYLMTNTLIHVQTYDLHEQWNFIHQYIILLFILYIIKKERKIIIFLSF